MQTDERDLLEVLKAELEFLNSGGYARAPGAAWRPVYVFEDSPACMNHDYEVNPGSCGDCVLLQLVPLEFRSDKHPCRHLPLNSAGETLDSLYRYSDEREIEEKVRAWLEVTIAKLEEHHKTTLPADSVLTLGEAGLRGTALHERAKCANPACLITFDWHRGGKFFRFRGQQNEARSDDVNRVSASAHGVRHFWLCERCSHLFTLSYDEHAGVILKISWPDLAASHKERQTASFSS